MHTSRRRPVRFVPAFAILLALAGRASSQALPELFLTRSSMPVPTLAPLLGDSPVLGIASSRPLPTQVAMFGDRLQRFAVAQSAPEAKAANCGCTAMRVSVAATCRAPR